jgi:hypothetical protein
LPYSSFRFCLFKKKIAPRPQRSGIPAAAAAAIVAGDRRQRFPRGSTKLTSAPLAGPAADGDDDGAPGAAARAHRRTPFEAAVARLYRIPDLCVHDVRAYLVCVSV